MTATLIGSCSHTRTPGSIRCVPIAALSETQLAVLSFPLINELSILHNKKGTVMVRLCLRRSSLCNGAHRRNTNNGSNLLTETQVASRAVCTFSLLRGSPAARYRCRPASCIEAGCVDSPCSQRGAPKPNRIKLINPPCRHHVFLANPCLKMEREGVKKRLCWSP
jgi:hypothetical protein